MGHTGLGSGARGGGGSLGMHIVRVPGDPYTGI